MRAAVIVLAVSSLTACAYHPGSFHTYTQAFPGERATIGCVDLAVDRRQGGEGTAQLSIELANRCDGMAYVDLLHAAIVARTPDGDRPLALHDPERNVRAAWIDGRRSGSEVLSYERVTAGETVCVDVSSIVPRAKAQPQWRCFGDPGIAPEPVPEPVVANGPCGCRAGAKPFGAWSAPRWLPPMSMELGMAFRRFPIATASDALARGGTPSVTTTGESAVLSAMRLTVATRWGIYLALDSQLGGSVGRGAAPPASALVVNETMSLGLRRRIARRTTLGIEAAGGIRLAQSDASNPMGGPIQSLGVLEARAHVDRFIAPWVSVGVGAGASALERRDWMTTAYIGLHSRTFGAPL